MNAYFQLVAEGNMTAVRLVPATDGGDKLNINEMMDYLHLKKIDVQNIKQLYQVALNYDKEIVVPVCDSVCLPQQEMMTVKISDDRMEAVARFYPPSSNGGSYRDKGDVIDDLRFHKITYGYDEAVIEKYLQNRSYCTDIVIARGTAPIHGTDAVITYYFNTDLKTRPSRNEDGSVDFFHLNTINHCKTGDVLASLKKAEEGVNGATVYGEVIRPRTIKHLVLKHGRNIEVSEDGCEMRSLINGHVCLTDDKVFVSDVYEVENVGTATGNIESEGSVQVNGNVQAGFEIRAKGNVEVRGVVEGAVIEAGGDIIIARGMNGMGKGILRAGGRVILKFAENATITAASYVESETIMHSTVSAGKYVAVDGRKGFIAGGVVRATEKISCKTLGSPMGADTIVEVGVNPDNKLRYQKLQKELMDSQKKLAQIQPVLINLSNKLRQGEKFNPDQMKYIKSLAVMNQQMTALIEKDKEEILILDAAMETEGQACVCVSDEAYAGTRISIGDASLVLKNSVKYCRFIRERGNIRITAY